MTLRDVVAWTRRTSGPSPRPSDRSRIIDASLATLLLAYALAALLHSAHEAAQLTDSLKPVPFGFGKHPQPPGWIDYLSVVFTTAPLAWRRRYPLAVFWIVIGAAVVQPGHGDAVTKLLACAIAAYTAAAHSPYRPAAIISLLGAAAAVAGVYQHVLPTLPKVLGAFLVIVPIAAAGTSLRTLRVRIDEAHQRERQLERDNAQATQLATEQERARIARELHDVITHNVSVMLVQAGAARKIMSRSPDQATEALLTAESAGRAAMTELQHTMGLLAPDAEAQFAPQPGLTELDGLIGRIRATGLRVELTRSGTPQTLTPGADLAAYRVIQEGLTNVAKHAVGAIAHIHVAYTPHEVIVEIGNAAGQPGPAAAAGNGRGLIGLRERVAACGGTLHTARRPDGGFHIRAEISQETA